MRPAAQRAYDANPGVRRQARTELRQGRYDENGNWVEGAPANAAETANDMRLSFGTGIERGVSGIVQLPRMAADANTSTAEGFVGLLDMIPGVDPSEEERNATIGLVRSGLDLLTPGAPQMARRGMTTDQIDQTIDDIVPGARHVPETTAGEYSRTVGEFVPDALFPGGIATRVARVVVPAVASETAGQLTEGSDLEPYARLLGALAGAGVTESSIQVLTRQGLTPDERALRLIDRELRDAGYEPEEIVRVMNRLRAQAPTEEVIGELLGPSGQRLMRATAAMGRGSGRSIADQALNARAEGGVRLPAPTPAQPNRTRPVSSIRGRVMNEAVEMTAPTQNSTPRSYDDAIEALRTARAGQGEEAYRALYAQNIDDAPGVSRLLDYLAEAPPEAAASASRQLRSVADGLRARRASAAQRGSQQEVDALNAELTDVVAAVRQLEGLIEARRLGDVVDDLRAQRAAAAPEEVAAIDARITRALDAQRQQMPSSINARAVDYFQRGLNQLERNAGLGSPEARAFGDARRAYNQMADDIVPGFGETRSRYGDSIRIEELMNEGRRVFEMTEGEIDRVLRGANRSGLSREEFDGFLIGVLDAVERRLGQSDTAFLARLTKNQNWRNQLEAAVGGRQNAERFMNRLARETNMQRTRNWVQSGSRTEPLREDIRALTQGESELSFMLDQEVRGPILAAGRMALTNPFEAAFRISTWIYDRTRRPGIANPQVQERMARRLFATATREGAQELRDAILALRADNRTPQQLRLWLNRVLAVNSANAEDDEATPMSEGGGLIEEYRAARMGAGTGGEEASVDPIEIDPARPLLRNTDGSVSTEETITIEADGRFYIIPTIVDGRRLSPEQAQDAWFAGINPEVRPPFNSQQEADAYARYRSSQILNARERAGATTQ